MLAVFKMGATFTLAHRTHCLRLHLHESHIDLLHDDSLAFALGTLFSLTAFCSRPATLMTIDVPIYGELFHGTVVKFFESYTNLNLTWRTLLTVISTSNYFDSQRDTLKVRTKSLDEFRCIKDRHTFHIFRLLLRLEYCKFLVLSRHSAPRKLGWSM